MEFLFSLCGLIYYEEVIFGDFYSAMLVLLVVDMTLWLVLRKVLDLADRHKIADKGGQPFLQLLVNLWKVKTYLSSNSVMYSVFK